MASYGVTVVKVYERALGEWFFRSLNLHSSLREEVEKHSKRGLGIGEERANPLYRLASLLCYLFRVSVLCVYLYPCSLLLLCMNSKLYFTCMSVYVSGVFIYECNAFLAFI